MQGRRIAFDFGLARIGVAICDPDGILATPLEAVPTKGYRGAIKKLIEEYQPVALYVGKPLHLSGGISPSLEAAREFAHELERFGIPIHLIDERFSTKSAARSLSEAGYTAKESKSKIDSAAAVAILECALAMEK